MGHLEVESGGERTGRERKREGREREKERVVCTVPMHAALPDCQLGLVVIESIVKLA